MNCRHGIDEIGFRVCSECAKERNARKDTQETPTCGACRFSMTQEMTSQQPILFCRFNPPTCVPVPHSAPFSAEEIKLAALRRQTIPAMKQTLQMRSLWPAMAPNDWCHQFQPLAPPAH